MKELINSMDNFYETINIYYERGMFRAYYEDGELAAESLDYDRLTNKLFKAGFRW